MATSILDNPGYVIGVVVAAVVGGFIATVQIILAKDQKTSEARRDWIEGLRSNLSLFFSSAQLLSLLWESTFYKSDHPEGSPNNISTTDILTFRTNHKELYGNMLAAFHDIQLRLGTNPKEYATLIAGLDDFYQGLEGNTPDYHLHFKRNKSTLRTQSTSVMKTEWDRVRDGEPSYRILKKILFVVAVGTFGLGIVTVSLLALWVHF